MSGSSPLARGLHEHAAGCRVRLGIIPARAGFTERLSWTLSRRRDHPRSRGVYAGRTDLAGDYAGSSPLARGLLIGVVRLPPVLRIIPARAGFTAAGCCRSGRSPDHPRSRGVYRITAFRRSNVRGSSPLARGLLAKGNGKRSFTRIIPARAGFTQSCPSVRSSSTDHPRSRGVY